MYIGVGQIFFCFFLIENLQTVRPHFSLHNWFNVRKFPKIFKKSDIKFFENFFLKMESFWIQTRTQNDYWWQVFIITSLFSCFWKMSLFALQRDFLKNHGRKFFLQMLFRNGCKTSILDDWMSHFNFTSHSRFFRVA